MLTRTFNLLSSETKDNRIGRLWRQERYENAAAIQTRVHSANKVWEQLTYKNERAMSFELFSKKLTRALQDFDKSGRPKHKGDIIDWIWKHIQCGELSQLHLRR